jgi:hypothetical protein
VNLSVFLIYFVNAPIHHTIFTYCSLYRESCENALRNYYSVDASDEAALIEQISELKVVFQKVAAADVPSEVSLSLSLSLSLTRVIIVCLLSV